MGYYTYFSLYMEGPEDKIKEVEEAVKGRNDEIEILVKNGEINAKWYDFTVDFARFAERFPDVLFCVSGDGEEGDDVWEQRFKGKNTEYHEVIMPPFTALLTNNERELRMKNLKQ